MQPTDSLLPWLPSGYFFNVNQPNQNPQQLQAHRRTHPSHNQRRPPQPQRPAHRRPAPPTSDQIAQFQRLQLQQAQAQALQHQYAQAPPPNLQLNAFVQQRPRNLPALAPPNNVALGANFGAPNVSHNPQLPVPQLPTHIPQHPTIPAHHHQVGALLMTSQFFYKIQWYCHGGPLETLPPLDNDNTAQNLASTNAALPAPAPDFSAFYQAPPPTVPAIHKPVPIPSAQGSAAPPTPSSPTPPPETPQANFPTPPMPVPVIHKPVPIPPAQSSAAPSHASMGIQSQPGKLQGPANQIQVPNGSAAPSQPSGAHQKDGNVLQVPKGSNTPPQGSSGAQIEPGKPQASNPTPPPEIPGGLTKEEIVAKIVEKAWNHDRMVAQRANRRFKKNQLSSRAPAPYQDEQSPTPDDVLLVELKSGAQIEPEPIRVQEESEPEQSGAQDAPAPTPNEPEPEQHSLEASPSQSEQEEKMENGEPEPAKTSVGATRCMSLEVYVAFISGGANQGAPSESDPPMDLGEASGSQMDVEEQAPNEQENAPAPARFPDELVEHRSVAPVPEPQNEQEEKMHCEPGPSEEEDELQKVALHADIETGAHVDLQDDDIEVIELQKDESELINLHQQTLRAVTKKFKKSRFLVRSGKRIPKMMAPKIARVRGAAPVRRLTKKKMSKSTKNAPEAQEEELKKFQQAVEYCEKNPLYDDPLFVSSVSLFDPYTGDTKVPQAKKIGENWFCLAQAYNKNMVEQGKANAQRDLTRPTTRARFEQLREKIAVEHERQLKMGLIFYENPEEMEWMKRFQAGTLMTGRM